MDTCGSPEVAAKLNDIGQTQAVVLQAVVLDWSCGFYNHDRRHSSAGMMSPINDVYTRPPTGEQHRQALHDSGRTTSAEPGALGLRVSL